MHLGVFASLLTAAPPPLPSPPHTHRAVTSPVFDIRYTFQPQQSRPGSLFCAGDGAQSRIVKRPKNPFPLKRHCTSSRCLREQRAPRPPGPFLHLLIDLTVLNRLCWPKDIRCEGQTNGRCDAAHYPAGSGSSFLPSPTARIKAQLVITAAPENILSGSFCRLNRRNASVIPLGSGKKNNQKKKKPHL